MHVCEADKWEQWGKDNMVCGIKQIIQHMQFLKSKESLTFEQLCSASPKQLELKPQDEEQYPPRPTSNHTTLKYYHRFIELSKVYCLSLLLQITLAIFYYELDYQGSLHLTKLILRVLIFVTVFSVGINILAFISYNQWRMAEGYGSKRLGFQYAFLTTTVILVQPYEFFENNYLSNWNYLNNNQIQYKLNYLLTIFSLFKFGIIIYSIIYYAKFRNSRTTILWSKYRPFNPYLFAIKYLFKQHPISLISSLFIFNLLFFSFAYRVSERNQAIVPNIFQYFENCLWMVFITMTTVGYGDCSPVTQIGRIFGLFCTFYGVIVVSITVLVVINTFQMDHQQMATLNFIKNLKNRKEIKRLAGEYIRLTLWRLWLNKRLRRNNLAKLSIQESRQEKVYKIALHQLINLSKLKNQSEKNLGGEMTRQFEQIAAYAQNLNTNFDSIISFLSHQKILSLLKVESTKII